MTNVLASRITARSACVVLALVLIAGVVVGRERSEPSASQRPAPRKNAASRTDAPVADLPVDRLERKPLTYSGGDLFARTAPVSAAPVSEPPKPLVTTPTVVEPPAAPPLPFRYLGQMERHRARTVLLVKGDDIVMAAPGDTVEDIYRIEAVTEVSVDFVYLPLGAHQALAIPPAQ